MMTRILLRTISVLVLTTLISGALFAQPQNQKSPVDKLVKKADAAFSVREYTTASDLYQQVLAADPNHYHSIWRMATINNYLQDYREAQRWLKKAIETDPNRNDTAYLELGLVLKRLNNYMKAKEAFLNFQRKHENKEDEYYLRAENEIQGCDFAEQHAGDLPPYRVDTISVNSASHDGFPVILDQRQEYKYILFTSHRPIPTKNKKGGQKDPSSGEDAYSDLYLAVWENDSTFGSEIYSMGSPINTEANDGSATVTGDGLTMYFTICQQGNLKKGSECSVYETRYDYARKTWTKPIMVQNVNGKQRVVVNSKGKTKEVPTNDRQPAVSGDGMTLVFSSDRDGGRGGFDLWVSHRTGDGWSAPENAGEFVNTPFNERAPFLSEDGTKLYFASDGHIGYGGLDLYISELKDGVFQAPRNVGSPINSSYDELGSYWYNLDSCLYFSSNRPGGKGRDDIYRGRFILYPIPPVTVAVQGVVRDKKTRQPVPFATAVIYEQSEDGSLVELQKVNTDEKARYNFPLEVDKRYKIVGNAPEYLAAEVTVSTMGIEPNERGGAPKHVDLERNIDIEIEDIIEIVKPRPLQNIYYDYDKYFIRADAAAELDKLADMMIKNPQVTIQMGSHTDTNGSENYNKLLSEKRAMAAVKYLVDKGIAPERLSWFGYGESAPIYAPEKNDYEEQVNRRTEFRITSFDYTGPATVPPRPMTAPVPPAPAPSGKTGTIILPNGNKIIK